MHHKTYIVYFKKRKKYFLWKIILETNFYCFRFFMLPFAVQGWVDNEMNTRDDYLEIRRALKMETDVQKSSLMLKLLKVYFF